MLRDSWGGMDAYQTAIYMGMNDKFITVILSYVTSNLRVNAGNYDPSVRIELIH